MSQISPNVSSGPYAGNGVQTAFAFNFSIVAASQILVEVDGVALASQVGYSVVFGDASGTVTFSSPPADGAQILLISNPDYVQTSNFDTQGAYSLATINLINRRAVIRDLVLKSGLSRTIQAPVGEAGGILPARADRDGRVLGFSGSSFIAVPNDGVAIAEDLIRAEAAATQTAADAEQTGADVLAANQAVALLPKNFSKLNDLTRTATTALAADAELSVPLGANSVTRIRGQILYTTTAAADFKWRHGGPASPARVRVTHTDLAPGAATAPVPVTDTAYSGSDIAIPGGDGSGLITIDATITNGSTAGDFTFSWAQNTSDAGNTTVEKGSYLEYLPLRTSKDFAFSGSAIAMLGDYAGPVSSGGHNVITLYEPSGISNSYGEAILTGSTATAQLFAGNYTITVDGVSSVVVAPAGWTFVTLFTRLPDAAHRVRIKGAAIDSDIAIRVGGTAPNCTRPPDITNYFRIYDPAFASYISKDGALDNFTGLYGGSIGTAFTATACGEAHRFNADTSRVDAWLYCTATSSPVELLKDGVSLGVITLPDLGMMERVTFATGLAAGAHEYALRPTSSGKNFYCFAIMVDTLTTAAHPNKSLYAGYGDSNMEMQVGEDARTHWLFLLAKRRGWANVRRGVGGQSISTWGRDNTALVTSGLSQPADVILNALGTNDYYFSVALATVQADCTTMLANERAGNASSPIVAIGIHDHYRDQANGTPYSNAARVAYNAKIQAAVAARFAAGDHNVFYIDPTGWISVTPGVHLRDAVHLNAAGFIAFEAALNSALVAIGL